MIEMTRIGTAIYRVTWVFYWAAFITILVTLRNPWYYAGALVLVTIITLGLLMYVRVCHTVEARDSNAELKALLRAATKNDGHPENNRRDND